MNQRIKIKYIIYFIICNFRERNLFYKKSLILYFKLTYIYIIKYK